MLEVELREGVTVRRVGGEELDTDEREDSSSWLLLVVCGDRTGKELLRGAVLGDFVPNEIWSFSDFRLMELERHFWMSSVRFSVHVVCLLLVFPLSQPPLRTLLSSEADLLSSDLNLDSEKRPLDRCPMLMLRTTRVFLEGLCKTCFNVTLFLLSKHWGETTTLSAG